MFSVRLLAFVSAYIVLCTTHTSVFAVKVITTSGPVRGEVVSGSLRFLGIPYARAPLGPRRFRPPEPPRPWTEVRDATDFGNVCMQPTPRPGYEISEDCLNLNIYLPGPDLDSNLAQKRAVMVWIHGGYWASGAGRNVDMGPMSTRGDVIGVTVNYRLGVFGFLTSGDDEIKGNAGLLDQVLALRWVQNNIEQFGGDKDRVTIFGMSAGSWSVSAHVLSPVSRGLFHRAISQSGGVVQMHVPHYNKKRETVLNYASGLGCYINDTAGMVGCLQNLDSRKLIMETPMAFLVSFGAVEDGLFFPRPLSDLLKDWENPQGLDYLAGINHDEGDLVLWGTNPDYETTDLQYGISETRFRQLLSSIFVISSILTPAQTDIIYDNYVRGDVNNMTRLRTIIDLVRDVGFLAPTVALLDAVSRDSRTRAYLYFFQQKTPEARRSALESYRAGHTGELAYVTGQVPESLGYNTEDKGISDAMVEAWTTFAKNGKLGFRLNDETILPWPQYDVTNRTYLVIDNPMTSDSLQQRLLPQATSFWNVLAPALRWTPPERPDGDSTCEEDSPSTIDRNEAETALFILVAVVIVLLLATAILTANYCSLKKQLSRPQDKEPIYIVETEKK